MIYLIYGSDRQKVIDKSADLIAALRAKKPDAVFSRVSGEQCTSEMIRDLCSRRGLFELKQIVHIAWAGEHKDSKEVLAECAEEMSKSEHVFIVSEGNLDAKYKKKLEAHAEKVQVYGTEKKQDNQPSLFSIADAFARKDKKSTWVLYTKAKRADAEDEQIHGIIVWQIKALLLAKKTKNAAEAGLNPYVYSKAAAAAQGWSEDELAAVYERAVALYHDARRGEFSLESGMERFILG